MYRLIIRSLLAIGSVAVGIGLAVWLGIGWQVEGLSAVLTTMLLSLFALLVSWLALWTGVALIGFVGLLVCWRVGQSR